MTSKTVDQKTATPRNMQATSTTGRSVVTVVPFEIESADNVAPTHESITAGIARANPSGLVARFCRIELETTNRMLKTVSCWLAYTDIMEAIPTSFRWGPLNPPTPLPRPYYVGDSAISGAGEAMIAARNIKRGETVVIERPLIIIPVVIRAVTTKENVEIVLQSMIDGLDEDDRRRFMALKNCKPASEYGPLLGRAQTNGLHVHFRKSKDIPTYSAICADISKVNHKYAISLRCIFSDAHEVPQLLSKRTHELPR